MSFQTSIMNLISRLSIAGQTSSSIKSLDYKYDI